jgi:hypothetical protein
LETVDKRPSASVWLDRGSGIKTQCDNNYASANLAQLLCIHAT